MIKRKVNYVGSKLFPERTFFVFMKFNLKKENGNKNYSLT